MSAYHTHEERSCASSGRTDPGRRCGRAERESAAVGGSEPRDGCPQHIERARRCTVQTIRYPGFAPMLVGLALAGSTVHGCGAAFGTEREVPLARTDNVCGPNCLYMLLTDLGHTVTTDEWEAWYPSHPDGMSMADLKDVCSRFGVDTEVRRCTPGDLRSLRGPAIAHMDMGPSRPRHFVLLTGTITANERIEVIDGTTAETKYYPLETITNIWTGWVLLVRRPPYRYHWIMAGGWLLVGAWGLLRHARRRNRTRPTTGPVALCLACALQCWGSPADAVADAGLTPPGSRANAGSGRTSAVWRTGENDGLCCLFLQLKQLGYGETFATYLQRIGTGRRVSSLSDLVEAANDLGYDVAPVRLTPSELAAAKLPLIVHLEYSDQDSGYFAVPLHVGEDDVVLFHGPSAMLIQMDSDIFRHQWSGAALSPGWAGWYSHQRIAVAIALLPVIALVFLRVRRRFFHEKI